MRTPRLLVASIAMLATLTATPLAHATTSPPLAVPTAPGTSCQYSGDVCFGGRNFGIEWGHQTINGLDASTIRGIRAKITNTASAAWNPPGDGFIAAWLGALSVDSNNNQSTTFIQAGLIDGIFAPAPGCTGNTAGLLKVFWYAIKANGTLVDCGLGQPISLGEAHAFNLQRCNGSDWCFYLDGTLQHTWTSSDGVGVVANSFNAIMECGTGKPSQCGVQLPPLPNVYGQMTFGGSGSAASPNLSVTPDGHDCGCAVWTNVRNFDTVLLENNGPFWQVDPVSIGSPWQIQANNWR